MGLQFTSDRFDRMTEKQTNIQSSQVMTHGAGMLSETQRQVIGRAIRQPVEAVGNLKGLGPMTRVSTSFGDVPAQALRARDMVRTKTGSFVKIERVDRVVLDEGFLQYHPEALPIRIRAGAFGRNIPASDVTLAPYQTLSSTGPMTAKRISRAVDALGRPNVLRVPETIITYTVIQCAKPTSVHCEGLWIDV